jgi:hypothetical protein
VIEAATTAAAEVAEDNDDEQDDCQINTREEIGPSRDKAVPALSHLTWKRGSILSGREGSQLAGMTFL